MELSHYIENGICIVSIEGQMTEIGILDFTPYMESLTE